MSDYDLDLDLLPADVRQYLSQLNLELLEGEITQKGFENKKSKLLAPFVQNRIKDTMATTPNLKNSFSLSSLPPPSLASAETPEQVRIRERPYNSLTKKPRKNEEKENWRKSWDSQSGKIGAGFVENYNYLMNTHLIDSCRSITSDGKVRNQANQLFQLSADIVENSFNNSLLESYRRSKTFNINSPDDNMEHEIKGLILCLECIESKLPPLDHKAYQELTEEDLAQSKVKHKNFHDELEALGRRIRAKKSSLIKAKKVNLSYKSFRNLDDRWQQLYLRSVEWEVCIDQLLGSKKRLKYINNSREHNSSWEHTDEPARKQPRLSLRNDQSSTNLETSEHILMDTSVPPEDLRPPQSKLSASQTCLSTTNSFTRMVDLSSLASDSEKSSSDSKLHPHSLEFSFDENIFTKDPSIFNNSARNAHNHAIIYHKHEDTVSESSEVKSSEISSDDETSWAYDSTAEEKRNVSSTPQSKKAHKVDEERMRCSQAACTPNDARTATAESCVEPCNKTFALSKPCSNLPGMSAKSVVDSPENNSIKMLVTYAELLVSRVPKAKRYHHSSSHSQEEKCVPVDSCDASGEYTTEDETCDTYSSEENTKHYEDQTTPKTILRSKSLRADRPRSMSILSHSHTGGPPLLATFSNSESALHTISLSQSVRTESSLNSSSTIEESCHSNRSQESSHCDRSASSSLKKNRKKHRRLRRSGLGSADNLSGKCARSSHSVNRTYVLPPELLHKAESLSGNISRHLSFSGEPDSCDLRTPNNTTDAEMDEMDEMEEEEVLDTLTDEKKKIKKKVLPVVPNFKIGKSTNSFPATKFLGDFTSGAEEQTSSFGTIPDEAWDNYQEKYHSEAYSEELPDSELLNQTLHFGEDYGSFIDRHSDLDSSVMDSESEEDVEKFVSKCKFKYQWCEAVDLSLLNKTKLQRLCRDIIQKLRNISEKLDDVAEIKDLTQKYEEFEKKLNGEEILTKDLEKELELLRREFTTLECRVTDIEDKKELINKILEIEEKKDKLSRVSGSMQDGRFFSPQEMELLYNKLEEKHKYFTKIATTWERLESDLIHFQTDVQQEVEKLKQEMGKSAEFIQGLIKQELSIIQDPEAFQQEVSKVLGEKYAVDSNQGYNLYHMAMPSCEGSDSGISDTEHDCERNRKLLDLKKLQKDLDSVLSSNKKTLIAKKMDETEAELRKLRSLRRLVFHSTMLPPSGAEVSGAECTLHSDTDSTIAITAPWNIRRDHKDLAKGPTVMAVPAAAASSVNQSAGVDCPDKPDPPYKSNSHLWRILKSALPFHLAIIVIACVVWLLEPNCCDNLNNLNLSSAPHLKYTAGPPPI